VKQDEAEEVALLVEVANVVGSRPDGWWRDKLGDASGLLESLAGLRETTARRRGGQDAVRFSTVVAVVEGAARSAAAPECVAVVAAAQDGNTGVVTFAGPILAEGTTPVVVTADRGLRGRLPAGSLVAGPEWLNRLVGR
jgi:hypothetical protein